MKTYIGIDNGTTGSIGFVGGMVNFMKTPVLKCKNYQKVEKNITRINAEAFYLMLSTLNPDSSLAIMERPMVNPTRFNASTSALRSFEAQLVVLDILKIPYVFIDSKEWQKELLPENTFREQLKHASLAVGNELYPELARVKHPDRDGLLIAHYGLVRNL